MVNIASFLGLGTALMATVMTAQAGEKDVLSEAYSKGDQIVELCGLYGENFSEFEAALAADPNYAEENSNDEYRVYFAEKPRLRILVIARERETAYPMAYCRTFLANPDGTSRMATEMYCGGEKEDCDAVFMEFYRHDQEILGF